MAALEHLDHLETINIGWLLLRTFIDQPRAAQRAHSLGLRGCHFVDVGFDYAVYDLLKPLCETRRRDIAGLRRELPDFFDVLDRGGPIVTDVYLRPLTLWFIDEAHYLYDARDLGFLDRITISDRNRRRDVEACLRYDMKGFAARLLPNGKLSESTSGSFGYRRTTCPEWDARDEIFGSVTIRVNYGRVGQWRSDKHSAWSPILLAQLVFGLNLRDALNWAENYLDRPDDLAGAPPTAPAAQQIEEAPPPQRPEPSAANKQNRSPGAEIKEIPPPPWPPATQQVIEIEEPPSLRSRSRSGSGSIRATRLTRSSPNGSRR
jgi:hypothetical protein